MIDVGSTLDLKLEDTEGHPVSLADHAGVDNVLIYFMRALSCAQCNAHAQSFVRNQAQFDDANVSIIVAVPEGVTEAAAWKAKKNIPYTVVVGEEGTPHQSVGLLKKVFGAMQQSGTVLVDTDGIVRYTHASTIPTTSFNSGEMTAALAELKPVSK
ncbi:peroxiredoxin family protein [Subtercola lobariae]|uniref:thioredoxin-dependent peroxiredoxin n=1 Tax=Subtercola lobariae TaxID=1588641 RepID=A0A917BB64_9MICO|nr:redoxin domain-containing protein [Subtercola lobariae]GGF33029.1 peroxiredoxin [Subtercola lobariae]